MLLADLLLDAHSTGAVCNELVDAGRGWAAHAILQQLPTAVLHSHLRRHWHGQSPGGCSDGTLFSFPFCVKPLMLWLEPVVRFSVVHGFGTDAIAWPRFFFSQVMPGDNATFTVELIYPAVLSKGLRFAVREGGKTVAAGVVAEILE